MSESAMAAAWQAVQARQSDMLRRLANPEASPPISTTAYTATELAAPPATENPKDRVACDRLPLDLWPLTATTMASVAMLNGALKYGRANWRRIPVKATVYLAACQRHMAAWLDGEEADEEGVPHLASMLASLAIIVDAKAAGTLIDDRPAAGGYRSLATELTPLVAQLRTLHASRKKA
jgi:hypothetical protein